MVTRDLPKVETTGSNPVARSRKRPWRALRRQRPLHAAVIRLVRVALALGYVLALWYAPLVPAARAAPLPPPTSFHDRSTLSIIRGAGDYSEQARGPIVAAVDGQDVAVGDRLVTGGDANLLLTFFEGSTFSLTPNTDVIVQRLAGDAGTRDITMRLNLGTIWARVVSFGKPSATFTVQGPSAAVVVRGSQIGARVLPDGTFQCWTREGQMDVSGAPGQQTSLVAGETVVVTPDGQIGSASPFAVTQSVLRLQVDGPVWPLVVQPDGTANGFVDPGVVVSQTFGALVSGPEAAGAPLTVEVPANVNGEFLLVLAPRTGTAVAAYNLSLAALQVQVYTGSGLGETVVDRRDLAGVLYEGTSASYTVRATVDAPGAEDAKLLAVDVAGPAPAASATGPARVLISPIELQLAGLQ